MQNATPDNRTYLATPAPPFPPSSPCFLGIIILALAYLVPNRLKDAHWGARIGRFPASRFFVCGGLDVNVCPRWTEQAA